MGSEQGKEYYDKIYQVAKKYRRHYSGVRWLPMFEKAATMIGSNILEIGCGPGQFAHLIYDKGIKHYTGVDFSEVAITRAKTWKLKGYKFFKGNIYDNSWYKGDYDTVVALEVLEHVQDFVVLDKIPSGMRMVVSLPTFPSESHLIYFNDIWGIAKRYYDHIDIKYIERISDWYLVSGEKR